MPPALHPSERSPARDTLPAPFTVPGTAPATARDAQPGLPDEVAAGHLAGLLSQAAGCRLLSLDCFDTIVWRHVDAPLDVFFDLAHRPAFRQRGITAQDRIRAERVARERRRVRDGRTEVTLADIYRVACPGIDEEGLQALAEDELAAEMAVCHAFGPAVALLRQAQAQGLAVRVVSDTYFTPAQLRRLLSHVLPDDAMAAIGHIVCSCEHGLSKAQGLFHLLHPQGGGRTAGILHVGDNPQADVVAPRSAGLRAIHLVQHDAGALHHRRMRALALGMLDPTVRGQRPMRTAYDAVRAAPAAPDQAMSAIQQLGYTSLGPLMHAFACWISAQAQSLANEGRRVKLLYLLRDGHLPQLAAQGLGPGLPSHRVRISRFTAYASAFRCLADIDDYLAQFASSGRFDALCRQLLLPADLARRITARAKQASDPVAAFCRQVRRPEVARGIFEASAAFRARLKRHLEREAGMQAGDTLVFVDLGYVGTAQRVLAPMMRDEWGVQALGRYLLAVRADGHERAGLVDAGWCDERTIGTLVPYVALLENLCACDDGSVIGYADDGEPILGDKLIPRAQSERVAQAQAQALRFVADAQACFAQCHAAPPMEAMRDAALAEFARMVFFPDEAELQQLEGFQLDMNMGTEDRLLLVDREAGLDGLRRHGMFFMEHHAQTMRMAYPAELRSAGIELSMTLLAQHRYGLDIPMAHWTHRHEPLELLVLRGDRSLREVVQAQATHDGYFAAMLPVGDGSLHLGVLLGQGLAWLQLHSLDLVPMDELMGATQSLHRQDIRGQVILDGLRDHGQGLLACETHSALLMVPAGVWRGPGDAVCQFVFRPLVRREGPMLQ